MLINIRHVEPAVITRSFKKRWTISSVYDWIESLFQKPEHFSLACPITKKVIFPNAKCEMVRNTTLNMSEHESSIALSEDENKIFLCR